MSLGSAHKVTQLLKLQACQCSCDVWVVTYWPHCWSSLLLLA